LNVTSRSSVHPAFIRIERVLTATADGCSRRLAVEDVLRKDCALHTQNLVFVVDDDPGTLRGLQRLLKKHGYDSVLFDSAQAFESCADFEGVICIVLDIQLAGVSGIEVRHRLIELGVSLPVIYITASDSEAVRDAAVESGCIAYLRKPFSAKSLIEPIEKAAARLAH
jgi:FixJ family two-component response regulator